MAETTGSLSRREMRERGKGVKPIPVDTEMEALGLSSVPGFERPLGAGPKDRFIGEDEAGNKIYKNDASGVVYTIKPNPDQRTLNTKAKDWWASWNQRGRPLLSREQVIEIAKQIPQDAYESVASAVRGEGTLGDVAGMAPAMGVASAPFKVPEGSFRIFGGRKATNPGIDSNDNLLPQSLGKDGEPRFEIVDKDAKFNLHDMSFIDTKKEITSISDFGYSDSLPSWSRPYKFLNEVFEHDELYRQYPSIGDIRVVIDNSLSGTRTRGYFSEEFNLIALNPSLKPEEAMSTLLHEAQHKVQKIEGFSFGTSIQNKELVPIAETIYALRQNEKVLKKAEAYEEYNKKLAAYEEAKKKYEIDLKTFEDFDYRDLAHVQLGFLTDMAEGLGLPFDEFFSRSVDSVSILKEPELHRLLRDRDELLSFINRPEPQKQNDFIFRSASFLSSYKDLPGFEQSGKDWFGEEAWKKIKDEKSFALGLIPNKPYLEVVKPTEPFFVDTDLGVPSLIDYDEAYRRKAGETEARNVVTRKDMTLEERFANPPESTEDRPRDLQWTEFAKGGEVKKDPVSGNKVPPNGTAKGVRDDVPALLSEGEYVIPENVVNTYGAKTFDRLVQQTNDMLKTQPGKVQKMAEGGFVENPTEADIVSGFNPDAYRTVGFSYFGGTAPTTQVSYTYVTYINANGDTIQIRVDANGNPLDPIPAGYMTMEAYQAQLQNTREEGNTTEEQQDDFTSYYTYDEEQFKQMLEDPSGLEKTMLDLFGGGIFGGLIEQDRITNLEAAAVVANDLGYTDVAQELLDKSKTLASEAGKPSKLTEWLSADTANVVDRHRDAAPTGLLETLTLTPVEPGKLISLDGRTPPPEAFTSTGVPATTTPVPVTNPGQYPLASTPTTPTAPPTTTTQGTTMESINDPAFERGATFIPQTPIETTTLPPAPTTQAYYGNDPRLNTPVGGMPAAPQPTEQLFPSSVNPSAAAVEAAQARAISMMQGQPTAMTTTPTQSVAPVGTSDTANRPTQQGLGFTQIQPAPVQQAPTTGTLPQTTGAPAPVTQVTPTTYYGSDPRLNTPVGSIPPAPTSVTSVAPTQPQVPTLVEPYYFGIDQAVTTKPTMPGELVTSPVPQAPSVGVAPVVNTQPPAAPIQTVNPMSAVDTFNPVQSVPPSVSDYVPNLSNTTVQPVSEKAFVQPTLETPTTVPVSGKTLGYPPTSGDNPPPSQQPPVPQGVTTAEKLTSNVPTGTASAELQGALTQEWSNSKAAKEATEEGVSPSTGIMVRSTGNNKNQPAVVMFEGEQYIVPVGETVFIAGQKVSFEGKGTVSINGLEGKPGDLYPTDYFVNYVPDTFSVNKLTDEIKKEKEKEKELFEDIEKVTGESDFADLRFDDESIFSDGDSTSSGGSSSNKTPTPVPTTTDLTTLSFGDTTSTPTGGGNVAPIEDYDTDNQPFAKGGLVKKRPAKYSKGGLVKRRIMATRK